MNSTTAEKIAKIEANNAEIRALRQRQLEQIKAAKATHNIRFKTFGVHTVCYRVDIANVLEFSTTIRNPSDRANKIEAQTQALMRFAATNRVIVRIPNHTTPTDFFRNMFEISSPSFLRF